MKLMILIDEYSMQMNSMVSVVSIDFHIANWFSFTTESQKKNLNIQEERIFRRN